MKTKNLFLRSVILICAILPLAFLDSCSYESPTSIQFFCSDTTFAEVTDSSSSTIITSQDTLIVFHGSACARSSKDGTEEVIEIEGSKDLPSFATNAAVFLNGWRLEYLDKDHHVAGLSVAISNVRVEEVPERKVTAIKWDAVGILSDQNFDDSYSMCYTYTIIAWSDQTVSLNVDQEGTCFDTDPITSNFFVRAPNKNTTTGLASYKSFLNNPAFIGSPEVGILPRGFGMKWSGNSEDHKILQIAYNLDHSEAYLENENYRKLDGIFNPSLPDSAMVDSGFVSWESHVIFKDNDARRGFEFGEIVSGLSGADLSVIDPPYSILPSEDDCGSIEHPGLLPPEEIVIKNIPFQYAVPMLTGWELGYSCEDQNLRKAGIRIENWSYIKDPVNGTGTLRYKLASDFSDKNTDNQIFRSHNVTILGIKPLVPAVVKSGSMIDLIPVIPPGSTINSFCRRDAAGNNLFVTIKNQGNTDAGSSVTTVMFGTQKVRVDTPPIKAGESVELQFRIPGNCFDPDCEFTINADSEKQIDEGSNEMNNIVNAVCKPIIL